MKHDSLKYIIIVLAAALLASIKIGIVNVHMETERANALELQVHSLTGQLEETWANYPHGCYVRGEKADELIVSFGLVKGVQRENKDERKVVSVMCY